LKFSFRGDDTNLSGPVKQQSEIYIGVQSNRCQAFAKVIGFKVLVSVWNRNDKAMLKIGL